MEFEIMEITNDLVFNYFFSLGAYYGLMLLIPTAILSLFRN